MSPHINAVTTWLEQIGLERYAEAFAAQDITEDVLPELTDADLKELGVATLGERKRMLRAIAALTGGAGVSPALPSVPPTRVDAGTPASNPGAASPASSAVRPHDAERRQLTVMFADMVGSTQLSARLDPEDLQHVIRSFHAAAASAVAPYDGHVAQYLGDGVLIYFGYPQAHEDDAERAVRAGLALVQAVAELKPLPEVLVQTRVGIATGRVVVGEIGAGTPAAEQTASGETPNLAARLQGVAGPGEIVMSDETRRLVRAFFEMESLGALTLKGFATPVDAWRVTGERSVASRFEAQHESEPIRLIGRESEVALLMERWALARDGEGQAVVLAGEAGIGKSRITHGLRERLQGQPAATVLLQCSPYFSNSALYPMVRYFERISGMTATDTDEQRIEKLARIAGTELEFPARSFGYLLRLMGLPDGGRIPAPAGDAPKVENAQLLQAPVDLLRRLSRQQPVLLLIEDAHWIDPTTDQLLAMALEQLADARVLIVITCRPDYTASWGNPANLTRLTLNRLGQRQSVALVAAVTGDKALPPEVLAEIIRKTDGIPLFVEELTRTVVQSGLLEDTPTGYRLKGPLPLLAIPSTLQDSLMARLDRLAPAKEVAQVGALIGREFSQRLLAHVLQMPEGELGAALAELLHAGLIVPKDAAPNPTYSFKHALIRDTASNSLLKSQWVLRHAQIAEAIEATDPETVAGQPELLAHHYQEGGNAARAFDYWVRAGELATARVTYREAMAHYRAALELLPRLEAPASKAPLELELLMKLGMLLMQVDGYAAPQTSACFARARELAATLEKSDSYVIACAGLSATLWASGRYRDVIEMLGHLTPAELAPLQPMSRVFRALVVGIARLYLGELEAAWLQTSEALEHLKSVPPGQHQDIGGIDPYVMVIGQGISVRFEQGYLDQADAMTADALEVAQRRGHPPTLSWALSLARWRAYRRGDLDESIRLSRELLAMAERMGFQTRIASGQMMLGRALVPHGEVDEGVRLLREGFAEWLREGGTAGATEYASHAAEVLLNAGRLADAAEFLRTGDKVLGETGERFYEAELLRLHGRLLELGGPPAHLEAGTGTPDPTADGLYRRALAVAEAQGAKLFSLRAATDLARWLRSQGRRDEGVAILRPVHAWFREGHDYPELHAARALLD